jgi:hypothetical protein
VKVIGISANGLEDHRKWAKDIEEWGAQFAPTTVDFPIASLASMNGVDSLLKAI